MSEEEIIKECNELAKNEHHELGDCWDEEYSSKAIQGLLDLYQKKSKIIEKTLYYIEREEINSIGTPFTYTYIGKKIKNLLEGKDE